MDQRTKIALTLCALVYALAAVAAFRLGSVVPAPTIYVLLGALYIIPIWLVTTCQPSERLIALLLIVTPLLPALIVVDPLEVGFYGYDPYGTLQTAFEFRANGPISIARSELFAWPGFYAFLWAVTSLVGLPVEAVGKYLPLIAVATPLLFYLFARRIIAPRVAFVAAMGFAGVRTLYTFQVKFLDETTAFVLFFTLAFLLAVRSASRRSAISYLAFLVAVGAVLTHHYVGALVGALLVFWDLTSFGVPSTLSLRNIKWPFSRLTVATGFVFIAMFLIVAPQFVGFLVSVADVSSSPSSEVLDSPQTPAEAPEPDGGGAAPSTPEPGSDSETPTGNAGSAPETGDKNSLLQTVENIPILFWKFLAANVVLVALLSAVVATARLWVVDSHPALLVSGTLGGVLAVGYGYSVVFGPVIPLDPSRYLIYMAGLLLVPAGYTFSRIDLPLNPTLVFSVLVGLLVLTQMVIVPPAVMYSSQEQTIVGEGHYSPSQFAASDWVSAYDGERVVGWEGGVWASNGISRGSSRVECSVLRVWRQDAPYDPRGPTDNVVYNNGPVELFRCSG